MKLLSPGALSICLSLAPRAAKAALASLGKMALSPAPPRNASERALRSTEIGTLGFPAP